MHDRLEQGSMSNILVTGATGNVGLAVLRELGERGIGARAGTRSGELPADLIERDSLRAVRFDFLDIDSWRPALEGIATLFLVRPPAISNVKRDINPFLDFARAFGVRHVVFLSLLGAESIRVVPHRKIEIHLEQIGLPTTCLRASFFMQNLTTTHLAEIRDEQVIAVPAGDGKTSFVDCRDVAAVAVKAMTEPGYVGNAYDLTGVEALGYAEVADMLSDELGRRIEYTDPSVVAFARRMRRAGHPAGFIAVTSAIYLTARFGQAGTVTSDVADLLGRSPITMREFIHDYRNDWIKPTSVLPA